MKYFVHDEEDGGFTFFDNKNERDKYAKSLIQNYLQDGWGEGVKHIICGIQTHATKKTNVRYRKDQAFDDEGNDGEGVYWNSDWDYVCNYELVEID